jgi:hypothetical protein
MTWRTTSAWPELSALTRALGAEVVKQMAAEGDGEAQYSQGCLLASAAGGNVGMMGAGGRSPMADVGLALSIYTFRVPHRAQARR